MGLKSSATMAASFAMARLHFDCSLSIVTGTSDMGQGARTIFAQLAAQELGISIEKVNIVMGDTAVVPFDMTTSASRSTVFMGNAILQACSDIKKQIRQMAAEVFDLPESKIAVDAGFIRLPDRTIGFAELLQIYYGPVCGEVLSAGSARVRFDSRHPLGGKAAFWELLCVAAEVEVDAETGYVQVTNLALAGDVGKALNPLQVATQDEGSATMGLGHTFMEHMLLDQNGRILNLGALDYRIPTIQDIPSNLHLLIVENADGPGPFGSKGAGEGGILAISAAIGSAVAEAIGVRIHDLPLTPERVWAAIQAMQKSKEEERDTLVQRENWGR